MSKSTFKSFSSLSQSINNEVKASNSYQAYKKELETRVSSDELNRLVAEREQEKLAQRKTSKVCDAYLKKAYGL